MSNQEQSILTVVFFYFLSVLFQFSHPTNYASLRLCSASFLFKHFIGLSKRRKNNCNNTTKKQNKTKKQKQQEKNLKKNPNKNPQPNGITAIYSQCLSTTVEPTWFLKHWFFLWWTCLKIVSTSICTLSNAVVSLASHNQLCIMCQVLALIQKKSRTLWVGEENSIKLIALV